MSEETHTGREVSVILSVRFTPAESLELYDACEGLGIPMATYAHDAIMASVRSSDVDR